MSNVKVTASKAGQVVNVSKKNPIYGYIRVKQSRMVINEEGWVERKTLSALINGKVENLRAFNWLKDQELSGKIRILERMQPFNIKDPSKDVKSAGDSGIICSVKGSPIYRNAFYSENEEMLDILIQHDNTEEIQVKNAELRNANEPDLDV